MTDSTKQQLSQLFSEVIRDGSFATLGGGRTGAAHTLAYADSLSYAKRLAANPHISALITLRELAEALPDRVGVVISEDPRTAFYQFHERFLESGGYWRNFLPGRGEGCRIHPTAIIDPLAKLGDRVTIEAGVIVGAHTTIEDDVHVEPRVTIGAEGILYLQTSGGIQRLRHGGGVRIGRGATLLAHSVVARSVHDSALTEVGERTIVGIASCVGHEALVGADVVISGNCVIARNAILEDGSFIGTNAFVRENLTVGKKARVMAGSVVVSSVPAEKTVSGNFAIAHDKRLKEFALQATQKNG